MEISYKEFGVEILDEVYNIYELNEWLNYLGDKDRLKRAFEKSLYILGAFHDGELVGFIRCVGDEEYIVYIQDIILNPSYFRQGIGRELMRKALEEYKHVPQVLLITAGNDKVSNGFYKSIGMTEDIDGFKLNTYFRSKNTKI